MTDIRSRLREVDRKPVPDLWEDIDLRRAHASAQRPSGKVAATLTGVAVGLLALGIVALVIGGPEAPPPGSSPSPFQPVVAGNGKVAFLRTDPDSMIAEGGTPHTDLYVFDPETGRSLELDTDVAHQTRPTWSPDGTHLAYVKNDSLISVHVEGGHTTTILSCAELGCGYLFSPAWSPDGTRIAMGQQAGSGVALWVANVDGSDSRVVIHATWFGVAAWSPDGRQLAINGRLEDQGDEGIFVIDSQTSEVTRRINLPGLDPGGDVDWSSSGNWLVFDALGEGGIDFSDPTAEAGAGIYQVRPDGTAMNRVATSNCEENACTALDPSWSPDGKQIIFTKSMPEPGSDGSLGDLFAVDVQTGAELRLTEGPGLDCCAAWQPVQLEQSE